MPGSKPISKKERRFSGGIADGFGQFPKTRDLPQNLLNDFLVKVLLH
jgi:hypothetical protein